MPPRNRIEPKPGQESVWDYPRPPRVEPVPERLRVVFDGVTIADTQQAFRVLETSHPPTYYIPQKDISMEFLEPVSTGRTFCEWKGQASYYNVRVKKEGHVEPKAAWKYSNPAPGFQDIHDHVCFYASKMEACYVGEEQVQAQQGDFYGGWITSKIVGPFKGGEGTWGW